MNDKDTIYRQDAIDATYAETVSTNPEHFKSSEKFIGFMDDIDISEFGRWQWANGFNAALVATKIQLEKLSSAEPRKKGKWIPIWPEDPNTFPPVDKEGYSDYVLLSFSNCGGLIIGQYRVDEDGGAFYAGDDEEPLTVHNLYVNAWQPLPSPYREEADE